MGTSVRKTSADTWEVLISFAAKHDEVATELKKLPEAESLLSDFLGDSPSSSEIRAFYWYLLYIYPSLSTMPKAARAAVNAILGGTLGIAMRGDACGISKWEGILNAPASVEVLDEHKALVSNWLCAIGMEDHKTAIGL